jgi:hypothetical protein
MKFHRKARKDRKALFDFLGVLGGLCGSNALADVY